MEINCIFKRVHFTINFCDVVGRFYFITTLCAVVAAVTASVINTSPLINFVFNLSDKMDHCCTAGTANDCSAAPY